MKDLEPLFPTREDFVRSWVSLAHAAPDPTIPANEDHQWAFAKMYQLTHDRPLAALELMAEIWSRDRSPAVAEYLAAGPLEDVLATHGEAVVRALEATLEADGTFRTLLGGVWTSRLSEDAKAAVERMRESRW